MTIYTVFFDTDEMPQDFENYQEAKEYGEERVRDGYVTEYTIECA